MDEQKINNEEIQEPVEEIKEEKATTEPVEETVEQPEGESEEAPAEQEENKQEEPVVDTPAEEPEQEGETTKPQEEEPKVEEPQPEEENKQEEKPVEEKDTQEPKQEEQEQKPEVDVEELKRKIEQLEEEKRVNEMVNNFANIKKQKEAQYYGFMEDLNKNFVETLKAYGIDPDKSLDDLRKEDAGKAKIAEQIMNDAIKMKEEAAKKCTDDVDAAYRDIVFAKAENVFKMFTLTEEQEKAAAKNFINIMMSTGIHDLGEELTEKVKFSVARAMMEHPKEAEKIAPATPEEIIETVNETVESKQAEENKQEEQKPEENKQEPTEPKIEIDEFKEGIVGDVGNSPAVITEDNVLDELAKLPYKERTAFYRQHYDMIERAAIKKSKIN